MALICDRCGTRTPRGVRGPGAAMAQGWSRFELMRDDGETMDSIVICPYCLAEAEERNVWPTPSPVTREAEEGRDGGGAPPP